MSNAYDSASLIVTANAYKAGKIYSLKPTDGTGDLTATRAGGSVGMRRNSSGLWEVVPANTPRLHYPVGGGCPSWLFEPAATNLFLNSNAPATQTIVISNSTAYTVTIYGTATVVLTGAVNHTVLSDTSYTFTSGSTSLVCTVSGVSGTCYVQVELGSTATSPIITAGSSVTRQGDVPNAVTIPLNQTELTLFFDGVVNSANHTSANLITTNESVTSSIGLLRGASSSKINLFVIIGGVIVVTISSSSLFALGERIKIAGIFKSGACKLFINGTQEGINITPFVFTTPITEILLLSANTYFGYQESTLCKEANVIPIAISDSEAIAKTTI